LLAGDISSKPYRLQAFYGITAITGIVRLP